MLADNSFHVARCHEVDSNCKLVEYDMIFAYYGYSEVYRKEPSPEQS